MRPHSRKIALCGHHIVCYSHSMVGRCAGEGPHGGWQQLRRCFWEHLEQAAVAPLQLTACRDGKQHMSLMFDAVDA
jgi:hypothetical protein